MATIGHAGLTVGLILGAGVLTPAGAQTQYEVPTRLILGGAAMQVADAAQEWAIRPADEADPRMHARDESGGPDQPSSDARSPMIHHDGGIRYVSGGVGESGRSELRAVSDQFNLHLMFATQGSGEYLSAVRVVIREAGQGTVLSAESTGPWFYAQLPPGDYSVEVTPTGRRGEGQTQRKAVHLDGSGRSKMDFYWKN